MEPEPPALGAWTLSHWTIREVPGAHVLDTQDSQSSNFAVVQPRQRVRQTGKKELVVSPSGP